jgi:hypothetical protein
VGNDFVGDFDLTAHGINADERTFELLFFGQIVEQLGDGGDFVGLFRNAPLCQHKSGGGSVGA